MPLLLTSQPGFTEIADATFDAGAPVTAATMKALNAGAKYAAVAVEFFAVDHKHGETVALPVSPIDGYAYSRSQLRYMWSPKYSASASRDAQGNLQGGATSGAGHLLFWLFDIDQATGLVSCAVAYHKDGGAQTNSNDGILSVMIVADRRR